MAVRELNECHKLLENLHDSDKLITRIDRLLEAVNRTKCIFVLTNRLTSNASTDQLADLVQLFNALHQFGEKDTSVINARVLIDDAIHTCLQWALTKLNDGATDLGMARRIVDGANDIRKLICILGEKINVSLNDFIDPIKSTYCSLVIKHAKMAIMSPLISESELHEIQEAMIYLPDADKVKYQAEINEFNDHFKIDEMGSINGGVNSNVDSNIASYKENLKNYFLAVASGDDDGVIESGYSLIKLMPLLKDVDFPEMRSPCKADIITYVAIAIHKKNKHSHDTQDVVEERKTNIIKMLEVAITSGSVDMYAYDLVIELLKSKLSLKLPKETYDKICEKIDYYQRNQAELLSDFDEDVHSDGYSDSFSSSFQACEVRSVTALPSRAASPIVFLDFDNTIFMTKEFKKMVIRNGLQLNPINLNISDYYTGGLYMWKSILSRLENLGVGVVICTARTKQLQDRCPIMQQFLSDFSEYFKDYSNMMFTNLADKNSYLNGHCLIKGYDHFMRSQCILVDDSTYHTDNAKRAGFKTINVKHLSTGDVSFEEFRNRLFCDVSDSLMAISSQSKEAEREDKVGIIAKTPSRHKLFDVVPSARVVSVNNDQVDGSLEMKRRRLNIE